MTPENRPENAYAAFDLTIPFEAVRSLIRRYAEDTDTPVTLDPVTGSQLNAMVSWGMAAAILAEMAATTGEVLHEWFPAGPPLDQLLARLDETIAQPGWSPVPEPVLQAAKHVVADYVWSPRPHDSSIDAATALGGTADQASLLDVGVMMCCTVLESARQVKTAGTG